MAKKIKSLPDFVLREGFFRNSDDEDTSNLPVAKARDKAWKGKKAFLAALADVESRAESHAYKGWSNCRCCGDQNGSADITLNKFGMKWVWPSGYSHYVEEHNIRPGLAFQEFIIAAAEALGPTPDDEDEPKAKKAKSKAKKEEPAKKKGIVRKPKAEVKPAKAKTKGVKSPKGVPTKKTKAASAKGKAAKAKAKTKTKKGGK